MKTHYFLIIILFSVFGCGKDSDPSIEDKLKLSQISIARTDLLPNGTYVTDSTFAEVTYDASGMVSRIDRTEYDFPCSIYSCDSEAELDSKAEILFHRNEKGKLTTYESVEVFGGNSIAESCIIEYDGDQIKSIQCRSTNTAFSLITILRKEFNYDSQGRPISMTAFLGSEGEDLNFYYREDFEYDNSTPNIIEVRNYSDQDILEATWNYSPNSTSNFAFNEIELAVLFGRTFLYNRNFPFVFSSNALTSTKYENFEFESLSFEEHYTYSLGNNDLPEEIVVNRVSHAKHSETLIINLEYIKVD
ncbi:hypothetical protein [Ekhidna sp.]